MVEIISDSERQQILDGKLADYIAVGVNEAWLIYPETRTVTIVRLIPGNMVPIAVYDETQTIVSLTFPGLSVPAAEIFRA